MKIAPADYVLSRVLLIWLNHGDAEICKAGKLDMLNEISTVKSEVCIRLYLNPPVFMLHTHTLHTHAAHTHQQNDLQEFSMFFIFRAGLKGTD